MEDHVAAIERHQDWINEPERIAAQHLDNQIALRELRDRFHSKIPEFTPDKTTIESIGYYKFGLEQLSIYDFVHGKS